MDVLEIVSKFFMFLFLFWSRYQIEKKTGLPTPENLQYNRALIPTQA